MASLSDTQITKALEEREKAIFSRKSSLKTPEERQYEDKQWNTGAIMMGPIGTVEMDPSGKPTNVKQHFTDYELKIRYYSTADLKFQDSSFGGDYCINPIPQFTRYADIRVPGKAMKRPKVTLRDGTDITTGYDPSSMSYGMGDYYSRALHDPAQYIYLRPGVPEFTPMTQFFTSFFNQHAANLARTGRASGAFFTLGQVVGLVVNVIYWPLLVAHAIGHALRFFMQKPSSRFYTIKPTPVLFWNSVNVMVNQIGVYKGLYPTDMNGDGSDQIGNNKFDSGYMKFLAKNMPSIFHEDGGIDVYSAALRAQRLKRIFDQRIEEILKSAASQEDVVDQIDNLKLNYKDASVKLGLADRLKNWANTQYGKLVNDEKESKSEAIERTLRVNEKGGPVNAAVEPGTLDYFNALMDDGADFAVFRVDYTGSVSESFSNSVVDSDLKSKFNDTVAKNQSAFFTFAGGNIAEGLGSVIDATKNFVSGVLDTFGASGLMSLAGSAFVDIPKHYENSTAQLPRSTYNIKLVSPYGNTVSQMTNIIVPLCTLLTMALPRAAGKQAYTWPFLIEYYDPGRAQSRLGMIDSFTVTRGTTNLGFNKENEFMSAEVSFSIVELSSIVSFPIISAFNLNPFDGVTDDENLYTDYMNILASVKVQDQIYTFNKLRLRLANRVRRYQMLFTPANAASLIRYAPGIKYLDLLYKGVEY